MDDLEQSAGQYVPSKAEGENETDLPTSMLKEGLLIRDLLDTQQVEFEVCPPDVDAEEDSYYQSDEVDEYLNPAMEQLPGDDGSGQSLFQRYAEKMQDLSGNGGVLKKVVTKGDGKKVLPGAIVDFHYLGYLENNHEPFDSTRLRNSSAKLRLGTGATLAGLEIALLSMNVNEVSQFVIRFDYAYGRMGCPPRIPASATILYEVEVLDTVDYDAAVQFDKLAPAEREVAQFEQAMMAALAEISAANHFFGKAKYQDAIKKYKRGIEILEKCRLRNEEEQIASDKYLLQLYVNTAITYGKMEREWVKVMTYCNKAINLNPNCVKALFWKGKAKLHTGYYAPALIYLRKAQKLEPKNKAIADLLRKLIDEKRIHDQKEKVRCQLMIASAGDHDDSGATASVDEVTDVIEKLALCVSKQFKEMVQHELDVLKGDRKKRSLPFTSRITSHELGYLEYECEKLGFTLSRTIDSDGNSDMFIVKPD